MGIFGAIKGAFSKAKSVTSKARGFDPFHSDDLMSKARQKIGLDDEEGESKVQKIIKSIGPEEDKSFSATVEDIVAEETNAKLEDKNDVQNVEKQGFFNKMLKNLPGAVGVLIAKDPGKALIQVLQSRTDYLVEQERAEARSEELEKRDVREGERLEIEKRKLKEEERQSRADVSFRESLRDVRKDISKLEEGGRMTRAENELMFRERDSERRLYEGIAGQVNRKAIAQLQIEGTMMVSRFNAAAGADLKVKLANMASDAERDKWRRDSISTLVLAGGGERPEDLRAAENLTNKMMVTGEEGLTEDEMILLNRAKNLKLTTDDMQKAMINVGTNAVKESMKARWQTDPDTGEQTRLPGLSQAETDAQAAQAVNSFTRSMGVDSPVHFGPEPTLSQDEQYSQNLDTLKLAIGGMTPDQAWRKIQIAVNTNYVTQEMADMLGYSDPNERKSVTERGADLDEAITNAPQSLGP